MKAAGRTGGLVDASLDQTESSVSATWSNKCVSVIAVLSERSAGSGVVLEISSVTKVKVKGAGPEDVNGVLTGAAPLVLYGHMDQFAERIKPETDLLVLQRVHKVAESARLGAVAHAGLRRDQPCRRPRNGRR